MRLCWRAWLIFTVELGSLIASGVFLSIYNLLLHNFSLVSGLKVLVGITAMGLFASSDSALECERRIADKVEREGLILEVSGDFFPLTSKLAIYAGTEVLIIVGVFSLLVIKDLD